MAQETVTSIELARVGGSQQQADSWFCNYGSRPICKLKSYLDTIELDGSQYLRLSPEQGSAVEPQVASIKFYCQLANLSEIFYKDCNEGQWLRTVIEWKDSSLDVFSSDITVTKELLKKPHLLIHSNVLPREALCPSSRHNCQDRLHGGFFSTRVIREESPHLKLEEHLCNCNECWSLQVGRGKCPERSELLVLERDDVEQVRSLGRGGQAEVHEVLWRGGRFARKNFSIDSAKDDRRQSFYKTEVLVAEQVSHPSIIHFFGRGSGKLEDYFLYMELMENTLFQVIVDRFRTENLEELLRRSPEKLLEVAKILLQVANAMEFIHEKGFIHGDLKLDNILWSALKSTCSRSKYPLVKVADFGKAQRIIGYSCQGMCYHHAAPEVKEWRKSRMRRDESSQGEKRRKISSGQDLFKDPRKIDVFSFGTIGYQVLSGDTSLDTNSKRQECLTPEDFNSLKEKLKGRKKGLSLVSLIEKCRAPIPEDRPEFKDICEELQQILQTCDDGV